MKDLTLFAKRIAPLISCAAIPLLDAVADETVAESVTWSESKTISDTLTVTGSGTTLTLAAGKAITVTPGAGKVVVTDGASVKASNDNSFVVAAEADGAAVESGVADVLAVSGGSTVCLDFLNNAAATGRIAVAGGLVEFDRYGGWKWSNPTFAGNPWIVDVGEGATAYFYHSGQGGHFNGDGVPVVVQGAGNVRLGQAYSAGAGGSFAVNRGAVIGNTGDLEFYGLYGESPFDSVTEFKTGAKVDGPRKMSINSASGSNAIVLQVNAGADFTARNIDFVRTGARANADDQVCGDGVIKIDASEADVTVAANVPATLWSDATKANAITFEKSGAHDALLAVTNIPTLVVAEGTATLTNDCTIGELTVADDATLVVDGATLRYASSAGSAGTIELRNGAAKVRVISGTAESGTADASLAMDRSGLASDATLEKTGETDLIVYDPSSVAGLVHVAGGALRFSKRGLSDKFFRLTVKKCYPWANSTYRGLFLKVGLYDADANLIDTGSGSSAAKGTSAEQLNENQWAVPEGSLYDGSDPSPAGAFSCKQFPNASWNVPYFTNATQTLCKDASDESGWQKIWGRLASSWAAIDGINFYSGWGWGIVKTWTVETSATGADGTWQVVQDIVDMPQELEYNGFGVLNGDAKGATPAAHFRYVEPGVTGLADTLQIRVDAGATLDFGAKTGGQVIDRVLIDATAESSGTVTNVVFAETGVIELVGGSVRSAKGLLPLVFEGASGTANLANWTVTCDGKTCNRRVSFAAAEKKIELTPFGTVMVVR